MERKITFGAELELADWDRSIEIPKELGVKDTNDMTVANSDGSCVNPYDFTGKGGEICTTPADSPKELIFNIAKILDLLDVVNVNHSCWLHIHVGLPEDTYDSLPKLKRLLKYVHKNNHQIKDYTSICSVKEGPGMTAEQRIRRNLTRTSTMTDMEYMTAMSSTDLDTFWSQFERKRHMVNMLPLKYQGTIEFRCFYMSTEVDRLYDAIRLTEDYVNDMLAEESVDIVGLLEKSSYLLPRAIEFNKAIEDRYIETLVEKKDKIDNFTGKAWGSK